MKKITLSILLLFIGVLVLNAQRSDRFDGSGGSGSLFTISGGSGFPNRTTNLKNAISSGEKNIRLTGNMTLGEIELASNVHIDIRKGTVIKHITSEKIMFNASTEPDDPLVENFKIHCGNCSNDFNDNDDPSERYTIDFSTKAPDDRARAFQIGNVDNFSISHFYVIDNFTKFNSMTLNPVIKDNTGGSGPMYERDLVVQAVPQNGDIKYGHTLNAHIGYGLVQIQAAKNVNFHYLSGVGGVTFRLESGATIANIPTTTQPLANIDDVDGYEIKCENGWSGVTLSPHGRRHESVTIENVRVKSCASGIRIVNGFQDKDLEDITDFPNAQFKNGNFGDVVINGVVSHELGNSAQIEKRDYPFYPEDFIDGDSFETKYPYSSPYLPPFEGDKSRINARSMGIVIYYAKDNATAPIDDVEGQYQVNFSGVTLFSQPGFNACIPNILYRDDLGDVCNGVTLSTDETLLTDLSNGTLFYNTANKSIDLEVANDAILNIIDITGKKVNATKIATGFNSIDASVITTGLYIIGIKQKERTTYSKLYIVN